MATINATSGDDTLNGPSGADVIDAGAGNDSLEGNEGNDTIYGGDDNDIIDGGSGDDVLTGGNGDDVIYAGAGGIYGFNSIYDGKGNDTVYGGADQDLITGSAGDDHYDGGAGDDWVYYNVTEVLAGITVDIRLATGQVRSSGSGDAVNIGVDTLVNIENVVGSGFDDVMIASSTGIKFYGNEGNDAPARWRRRYRRDDRRLWRRHLCGRQCG